MMDPIFILGAHKSGTSLLRSLFDGHEDLVVLPIETHCFHILNCWIRYPLRYSEPTRSSWGDIVDKSIRWIMNQNESSDPQADSMPSGLFDIDEFIRSMRLFHDTSNNRKGDVRVRHFIDAYFNSIASSVGLRSKDTNNIRFVEKSVDHCEYAIDLSLEFPDAHFIHIVRNPYANLVSLRKYKTVNSNFPYLGRLLSSIYDSFYFNYRNSRVINKYYTVRYEDLVSTPEATVRELCDFVGVEYNDRMLRPTYLGKAWRGNSTARIKFLEISDDRLKKWRGEITPIEVALVDKKLKHVVREYYAEMEPVAGSVLLPAPRESVATYLRNRAFLYSDASSEASLLQFVSRNVGW